MDGTLTRAMELYEVPVVVDFRVRRDTMVWPMLPPGTEEKDVAAARALAPEFEEGDL